MFSSIMLKTQNFHIIQMIFTEMQSLLNSLFCINPY